MTCEPACRLREALPGLHPTPTIRIQERDGSNQPKITYTRGLDLSSSFQGAGGIGGLLAMTYVSTNYYYDDDGIGNVVGLVDTNKNRVATYVYSPFGQTIFAWGPLAEINRFRFSSKEYHAVSGTYYYAYRFYDPNLQRWLDRDPTGVAGGINLYGFLQNNPVGLIDPNGLTDQWHHLLAQSAFTPNNLALLGVSGLDIDDARWGWQIDDTIHSYIHPEWENEWKDWVDDRIASGQGATVSDIDKKLKAMQAKWDAYLRHGKRAPCHYSKWKAPKTPSIKWKNARKGQRLPIFLATAATLATAANASAESRQFANDLMHYAYQLQNGRGDILDAETDLLITAQSMFGDSGANALFGELEALQRGDILPFPVPLIGR